MTTGLGYTPVNKAGDTMTGLLVLSADPGANLGASTKQYVDSSTSTAAANYVRKDGTVALTADWDINGATAGGTLKITGLADPTVADGAATKNYSDTKFMTKTLPAAPTVTQDGQSLRWNNTTALWEYFTAGAGSGTVSNVTSVNSYISIATGTTTPAITLNVGTAANTVAAGNDSRITGALQAATAFTGDVSGVYSATSVDKIKGTGVSITALGTGNFLRYNGTNWVNTNLALGDVTTGLGYTPVNKAGDTMTGLLVLSADPGAALGAATKQYVDTSTSTAAANYVRKDGTVALTADWDVNGATAGGTLKITGLADPTVADGASTKNYVDTGLSTAATKLITKTLPAAPTVAENGQSLRWNNGTNLWEYYTAGSGNGTVTNVSSVNSYISIATGTSTPAITLNVGTAANTVAAGNDSRITGALAAATAFTGDVSGVYSATSVDKIKGTAVSITALGTGNFFRYNGTNWVNTNLSLGDVTTGLGYTPVNKAGDTMTGLLVLSADPGANLGASTKQYVDSSTSTAAANYLRKDGTVALTADWDMNGATAGGTLKITGLADPTVADGAATKNYVDTGLSTAATKLITKTLPAAPTVAENGQSLRWNNGTNLWEYYTAGSGNGTVSSVTSANSYLSVGTGSTTPLLTVNVGTTANTLAAGNDSRITGALQAATAFTGDVSGVYSATSVDKIKGTGVSITALGTGNFFRYDGTNWVNTNLVLSDVTTGLGYTPVNKAGDTMTGLLVLSADPSGALGAATKQYVDAVGTAAATNYLRKDGTSVLSADWDIDGAGIGTRKLTGLADPTTGDGAVTKNYSDTKFMTKTLPTAPTVTQNGQSLRWNNGTNLWEYYTSNTGTVTNVTSVNSYISVATGTSTPAITLNVGTAANTVAAGDDSRITGAFQSATAFAGDVSGVYSTTSVDKIKGTGVSITALGTGNFFRYNGTNWVNTNLSLGDVTTGLGFTPVNKAGDTMTGLLVLSADPGANLGASTKQYVDSSTSTAAANYIRKDGTVAFTGNQSMGSNKITNLAPPLVGTDAANKTYADTFFGGSTLDLTGLANGQTLSWNSALTKWVVVTPTAGTVTSVTGTAPITVGGTAAAPVVSLATSGVAAGTFSKVTVSTLGLVTSAANIALSDVTTALGFTPLNKAGDAFTGTVLGKASVLNGTTTVDFATGNIQHTAASCGAFNLNNMTDGGTYLFIVKGATSGTCSFSAFTGVATGALTVHMPPGHGASTASKHTLYNFLVSGTDLYVSYIPGY